MFVRVLLFSCIFLNTDLKGVWGLVYLVCLVVKFVVFLCVLVPWWQLQIIDNIPPGDPLSLSVSRRVEFDVIFRQILCFDFCFDVQGFE